jgi:hypothetical protein
VFRCTRSLMTTESPKNSRDLVSGLPDTTNYEKYWTNSFPTRPEMFPVIPGTKLSICKTNEFAGASFSDIPSLAYISTTTLNTFT